MLLKFLDFHIQYFRLSFYAQSLCAAEAGQAELVEIGKVLAVLSVPKSKIAVGSSALHKRKSAGASVDSLPLTDASAPMAGSFEVAGALKDVEDLEESFHAFKVCRWSLRLV